MMKQESTDKSTIPVIQSQGMKLLLSINFFDGMSTLQVFRDENGTLLFLTESFKYSGGSSVANIVLEKDQGRELRDFLNMCQDQN